MDHLHRGTKLYSIASKEQTLLIRVVDTDAYIVLLDGVMICGGIISQPAFEAELIVALDMSIWNLLQELFHAVSSNIKVDTFGTEQSVHVWLGWDGRSVNEQSGV